MIDAYTETAFESFLCNTQEKLTKHCLKHGYNLHTLQAFSGHKYWKIILVDGWYRDQHTTYVFVRKSDGAILKARSNDPEDILAHVTDDDNGASAITPYATIRGRPYE